MEWRFGVAQREQMTQCRFCVELFHLARLFLKQGTQTRSVTLRVQEVFILSFEAFAGDMIMDRVAAEWILKVGSAALAVFFCS